MLWGDFSDFFCRVFDAGLFSFSGLKNVSSVLQHTTQQTFFFHLRHSQYTQSHFRFSGLKILRSDSRTWKQKFSFPDLKIWVQFYDTKLNRHSFCIHATVNIRNSISDVLELKVWVQIPEFKNMSSVFRTWKMWVQFSGPKFWGRDLEKIKGKNQKIFKVPKMSKNVSKCPNVFWGDFFENVFLPSVPWSHRKLSKKSKKFQNCRNAQNRCQNCPNLFWTCFVAIFLKKKFSRVPWRVGFSKIFKIIKKISKFQNWPKSFSKVSKRVLNMLWGDFSEFLCPVFHAGLFRFSGLKDMRSVFWT